MCEITYHRNDVRHTISRVNDGSGERPIRHLVRRPRRCEGKNCLDRDIQTSDVEGLEEDLRSRFAILWWIQWGLGLIPAQLDVRTTPQPRTNN